MLTYVVPLFLCVLSHAFLKKLFQKMCHVAQNNQIVLDQTFRKARNDKPGAYILSFC